MPLQGQGKLQTSISLLKITTDARFSSSSLVTSYINHMIQRFYSNPISSV